MEMAQSIVLLFLFSLKLSVAMPPDAVNQFEFTRQYSSGRVPTVPLSPPSSPAYSTSEYYGSGTVPISPHSSIYSSEFYHGKTVPLSPPSSSAYSFPDSNVQDGFSSISDLSFIDNRKWRIADLQYKASFLKGHPKVGQMLVGNERVTLVKLVQKMVEAEVSHETFMGWIGETLEQLLFKYRFELGHQQYERERESEDGDEIREVGGENGAYNGEYRNKLFAPLEEAKKFMNDHIPSSTGERGPLWREQLLFLRFYDLYYKGVLRRLEHVGKDDKMIHLLSKLENVQFEINWNQWVTLSNLPSADQELLLKKSALLGNKVRSMLEKHNDKEKKPKKKIMKPYFPMMAKQCVSTDVKDSLSLSGELNTSTSLNKKITRKEKGKQLRQSKGREKEKEREREVKGKDNLEELPQKKAYIRINEGRINIVV